MTYNYSLIYTRLSTETPFFTVSPELTAHIDTKWRAPGALVTSKTMSVDGLTKTSNVSFNNYTTWLEFIDDPVIIAYLTERNTYHVINNITVTRT
jgi:hypothetical protein